MHLSTQLWIIHVSLSILASTVACCSELPFYKQIIPLQNAKLSPYKMHIIIFPNPISLSLRISQYDTTVKPQYQITVLSSK